MTGGVLVESIVNKFNCGPNIENRTNNLKINHPIPTVSVKSESTNLVGIATDWNDINLLEIQLESPENKWNRNKNQHC